MVLPSHFPCKTVQPTQNARSENSLSADELNAMQYACGYVPRALLRKYEKRTGSKFNRFVECLGEMAVDGAESEFLMYTKRWIEKVNHGGLFPLNDMSFIFFTSVEIKVHSILPQYIASNSAKSKEDLQDSVIAKVVRSEEVQWNWIFVSQCILCVEDSNELLREIIELWVTIKGFSIVASWMETYKGRAKETRRSRLDCERS